MKWFYKDKRGKLKTYTGEVFEKNGKYYGILKTPKVTYEQSELKHNYDKEEITSCTISYSWNEPNGTTHNYDEVEDGQIRYDKDNKPYIKKMINSIINLKWNEGE